MLMLKEKNLFVKFRKLNWNIFFSKICFEWKTLDNILKDRNRVALTMLMSKVKQTSKVTKPKVFDRKQKYRIAKYFRRFVFKWNTVDNILKDWTKL